MPLGLSVMMRWTPEHLRLVYTVRGNTAWLRIPPATTPGPADGLWQHTCLEAFVASESDVAYNEFNFSPSGQWASYRFASERQRDTLSASDQPAPLMHLTVTPTLLTLDVQLPLAALPSHRLELALCAVMEEHNGRLSYWALQHPQARPDFHHPTGRSLRLALPQN
jgi:hypothetical protein